MAKLSPMDAAYRRCRILTRLVERARSEAVANPSQDRWKDFEITASGDTRAECAAKVTEAFDQILNLLNHVTILDMAASFEMASKVRLATRIGETRSAVAAAAQGRNLPAYHAQLVRSQKDFDGLASLAQLLTGHIDEEVGDVLHAVRESRNAFAHGTDVTVPPKAERDEALSALTEALSRI